MAEDTIAFELVSPERLLLSVDCAMVVVPGAEGDMGVLPQHAPAITSMRPGTLIVRTDGEPDTRIFVARGFAEITPERCTVLTEEAEPVDEIDSGETRTRIDTLQGRLAEADEEGRPALEAEIALLEARIAATENAFYQ